MEDLKKFKGKILLTSFVVMLPAFIGMLLWNKLPNQIATHFGYNGEPNGYSSKIFAVLGLPLILLACHVLCTVITKLDPKKQNISDKIYSLILWICPLCSVFVSVVVYGYTLGYDFNISSVITAFVGGILMIADILIQSVCLIVISFVLMVVIPYIYSFLYYYKTKK